MTGSRRVSSPVRLSWEARERFSRSDNYNRQETPLLRAAPNRPALEIIALNRMGFGPRPGDLAAFRALGNSPAEQLAGYVEQQLRPNDADDPAYAQKRGQVLLRIRYENEGQQIDQNRPLNRLDDSPATLWALYRSDEHREEQERPLDEVMADSWLRAVYSKWQLRELLVDFWHNHFNVRADMARQIRSTWPAYDRLMRSYALGNFRVLLGEVARSVPMNYYLNNQTNRSGGPNENYARELFELHTLGSDHYLNALFDDWKSVPGALADPPAPIGYIDGDVYEAARAFTGWKIGDGSRRDGYTLPDNGQIVYVTADGWFDRFQKRVLATEMPSDLTPEEYGNRVLDLVGYHPATAWHMCSKLCRRLLSDQPPVNVIQAATETWMQHQQSNDQIAQVVRTILLAPEFAATWGEKVKRPFELIVSFIRAVGMDFPPRNIFDTRLLQSYYMDNTGWFQFRWPTPTGHPDVAEYWLSSNGMLRRWNVLNDMLGKSFWRVPNEGSDPIDIRALTPAQYSTSRQIVDYWAERILGRLPDTDALAELYGFMAQDADPDSAPEGSDSDLIRRSNNLATLIAMLPDFQWR